MGTNTSKIKDILFVTGESLDPPEAHIKQEYRPHKQVQIDYTKFTPKSYYKADATDQQLDKHLKELERKENILKQFKHYKDFDRIDYKRMDDQVTIFELLAEESIKLTVMSALVLSRIFTVQHTADYYTTSGWRRMFWPCLAFLVPCCILKILAAPEYHIVNHEYFRMLAQEQSQYVQFDQKYNLYKDVHDMKYNFKFRSLKDYYKTRRFVLDSQRNTKKGTIKQYFQYQLGLKVEPFEEYAKSREKARTGNWEILTPAEQQQIRKELKLREAATIKEQ